MNRTVIIDGDVLIYRVADAVSDDFEVETTEDDDFIYRLIMYAPKQSAIDSAEKMIERIKKLTETDCVYIALSDRNNNFRKVVNPEYKANRKNLKPVLYDFLRNYFKEETAYTVYERDNLEADDVIGILSTSTRIIQGYKIIWSMDKDFKTIPADFVKELPDKTTEIYNTTEEEANWWFMYQTLTGDPVDGYKGCYGIGDKKARKILGKYGEYSLEEMWKKVENIFIEMGQTKEDALLNARMARILRADDYDFKKKEVILWKPKR